MPSKRVDFSNNCLELTSFCQCFFHSRPAEVDEYLIVFQFLEMSEEVDERLESFREKMLESIVEILGIECLLKEAFWSVSGSCFHKPRQREFSLKRKPLKMSVIKALNMYIQQVFLMK